MRKYHLDQQVNFVTEKLNEIKTKYFRGKLTQDEVYREVAHLINDNTLLFAEAILFDFENFCRIKRLKK